MGFSSRKRLGNIFILERDYRELTMHTSRLVVAYKRLKTMDIIKPSPQKVVRVPYEIVVYEKFPQ